MTNIFNLLARHGFVETLHILTSPHSSINRQTNPRQRYAQIRKSRANGQTGRVSVYKVVEEPEIDDKHCHTLYRRVEKTNCVKEETGEWLFVKRDIVHKKRQGRIPIIKKASKKRDGGNHESRLTCEKLTAKPTTTYENRKHPRVTVRDGKKGVGIGDIQSSKERSTRVSIRDQQPQRVHEWSPNNSQPSHNPRRSGGSKHKNKTYQKQPTISEGVVQRPSMDTSSSPQNQRIHPSQSPPRTLYDQSTIAVRPTIRPTARDKKDQDTPSSLAVPGSSFQQPGLDIHQSASMIFGSSSQFNNPSARRGLERVVRDDVSARSRAEFSI